MHLPQNRFSRLTGLAALLLTAVSAQATVITVTAIADNTAGGYNSGSPYTFSFTVAPSVLNVSFSSFNSAQNFWYEDVTADDQIFTSITGSGLSGSFTRPVTAPTSPFSYISLQDQGVATDTLWFFIGSNDISPLGVTVNGLSGLESIELQLPNSGLDFNYPSAFNQPATTILAAVNNSNPLVPGAPGSVSILTSDASFVTFTVNSFSVDSGIPNVDVPFGVDSSIGLGLLGLAAGWKLRRRRKA